MRIYLDFDGVLHRRSRDRILFEYLDALEDLLRTFPNTHVVISSSWREAYRFEEIQGFFSDDIAGRVVGVTPVLKGAKRVDEVMRHVRDTKYTGSYVVLDDDASEFPDDWPPLLLCNPDFGFNVERQTALLAILNQSRP